MINDGLYHNYTQRLIGFAQEVSETVKIKIPTNFNFSIIQGVSNEVLQALNEKNLYNLSDIQSLQSMTYAAFMAITKYLKRKV